VVLGIASTDASAFALGQLKVQSALGEPLRAEIESPRSSPPRREPEGQHRVAEPSRARRPYNAALRDVRVDAAARADGRTSCA
jgi:pilus assembly protein FimV